MSPPKHPFQLVRALERGFPVSGAVSEAFVRLPSERASRDWNGPGVLKILLSHYRSTSEEGYAISALRRIDNFEGTYM